MKIETTKKVEETTLVINNKVEIEIRAVEEAIYLHLFSHTSNFAYIVVHDWEGKDHTIALEAANQVLLDQILNSCAIPNNP